MVLRGRKKKSSAAAVEMVKSLSQKSATPAIEAANMTEQIEAKMAEREDEQERADLAALASIKLPIVKTKKTEVLAKQLREGAKKDAAPAGQVLQTWIHERS